MAVTVRDLLKTESLQNFRVVAGESGMDKTIARVEILDFEFMEIGEAYRQDSFIGDSLGLTRLLFSKDDPALVTETIRKLDQFHCHALAYKPVIFKELPREALDYADSIGFPVLEFGGDEFFEDIIFDIRALTEKVQDLENIEPLLNEMMTHIFSRQERDDLVEQTNPMLRPYVKAWCVNPAGKDGDDVYEPIRFTRLPDRLQRCGYAARLRGRYVILVSGDRPDPQDLREKWELFSMLYQIREEDCIGESEILPLTEGLDNAILQAYWAEVLAEIYRKPGLNYREIGINKLYIPWPECPTTEQFAREYLAPLGESKERSEELWNTAVTYVLSDGDMNQTAEALFCHKNTIRYRIGKLMEKLDPDATEKGFYQNLFAAVMIDLLMQHR